MLRTLRHIVFIRPGESERAIRQAASGNSLLEKTSYDGTNQEAVRNSSDSLFDHKGRLPAADAGKVPAGLGERSSPKEEPAPDKGGTPPATPVRKNFQSVPQSVLKVRSNRSLHRHGMRLVEIYPRMRRSGTTRRIEGRPRLKAPSTRRTRKRRTAAKTGDEDENENSVRDGSEHETERASRVFRAAVGHGNDMPTVGPHAPDTYNSSMSIR